MNGHRAHSMSAGVVGLLVVLCSCGTAGTSETSTTSTDDATPEMDRQEAARFCDSYLAADALVGPAMAAGGSAMADVRDAFAVVEAVPPELEGALTVMRDQVALLAGDGPAAPPEADFRCVRRAGRDGPPDPHPDGGGSVRDRLPGSCRSTAEAPESGVEPDGPPHFTEGMFVELVVSA